MHESGFVSFLKEIIKLDKIIIGMSAGAHVFCEYYNDSIEEDVQTIQEIERNIVRGLGILKGFSCEVHFNKYSFVDNLKALRNISQSKNVVAIEERSAVVIDMNFHIIKTIGNVFSIDSKNMIRRL